MKQLSGSEAKGRNGYFHIAEIDVAFMWNVPEQPIRVEVYSKKRGDTAPLALFLSAQDARAFIEALTEASVQRRLFLDYPEYASRLREVGTLGITSEEKASLTKEK